MADTVQFKIFLSVTFETMSEVVHLYLKRDFSGLNSD